FQSAFSGVREMKASGVRQQSGVDAFGDLFGNFNAERFTEIVDHLSDGSGGRIDPVDISERNGSRVVIDVDYELIPQAWKPGPSPSPSGRTCEVIMNRCFCSISCTT